MDDVKNDPLLMELQRSREIRDDLIKLLLQNKTEIIKDAKMLGALQKLIADNDKVTLGRMRIKVDEKANDVNVQTARILANLAMRPEIKNIGVSDTPIDRALPSLPEGVVEISYVPGEMDQGVITEDCDTFMKRMQEQSNSK